MADPIPEIPWDFADHAIREAVLQPANLRAVLRHALGDLADRFDVQRREVVPRTFLLDDWREREADVLLRIPFRDETERLILVCLLLEHQSKPDPTMPLRSLLYAVLFWNQEWKDWDAEHGRGEPLRLTPVVPIVLHTGPYRWTVARQFTDLFACAELLKAWQPQWALHLWDLAEHTPQQLLAEPEAWSQLLVVIRAQSLDSTAFRQVLGEALQHLEPLGLADRSRWQELLRLVLYWSLYRREQVEQAELLQTVQASHRQGSLHGEVDTMAQQVRMTFEQEVYARGIAKGKVEGRLEGEIAGMEKSHRKFLIKLLREKFKEIPQALQDRIGTADLTRLEAAIDQVSQLQSLDELRL